MKQTELLNRKNSQIILRNLKITESFLERFLGLMGKTLDESEGLLISPCNSIHCFFMRIPIEVLFLDKENKVIKKIDSLKPWRISPIVKGAICVIEAGDGVFRDVKVGDFLEVK